MADTYEFMLYFCIEKGLDNGSVTIKDSLSYKSLDDELLPNAYWHSDKDNIMKNIASQLLFLDIEVMLNLLESQLNKRYIEVNNRINSGANDKIKFKFDKNGAVAKWHLPYKKMDDSVNNPFFDNIQLASLNQIIRFTDEKTNFMEKFIHILPSNSKVQPELSSIGACIVAKATGIDIGRMKDISDIHEQECYLQIGTLYAIKH